MQEKYFTHPSSKYIGLLPFYLYTDGIKCPDVVAIFLLLSY